MRLKVLSLSCFLLLCSLSVGRALALPYDIIYVSSPRPDSTSRMRHPEVFHPLNYDPGTHLELLPKNSTTPQRFFDAGADGAAFDAQPDFTATWVYFAWCKDVRNRNVQRRNLPRGNCDLYKKHVQTGQVVQLTEGEFTPLAEGAQTTQALGFGVFNTGPAVLPGHKVAFTSSRNNLIPSKEFTDVNMQLFILDELTGIVEQTGYLNLGSALHPVTMTDGRVLWSSYEGQGTRDHPTRSRLWGLWLTHPDGREYEPDWSAFQYPLSAHWHGQKSDGKVLSTLYYNEKVDGFGGIVQHPYFSLGSLIPFMRFGSPNPLNNPALVLGARTTWRWPFQPGGMTSLVSFGEPADFPSAIVGGKHVGKVSHPSGAPGNAVLLTWSGESPTQASLTPAIDAGIYLLPAGVVADHPSKLQLVINNPSRNERQAKALVPYKDIYGIDQPPIIPWLQSDPHPLLPPGSPYALLGSSSLYKRDSAPGQGTDYFNQASNPINSNWIFQGADVGKYTNDDIWGIRIILLDPTGRTANNALPFFSHMNERARVLGDVPVRKPGAPLDPDGNPDSSFFLRMLADQVHGMLLIDEQRRTLAGAQTYKQLRPREIRTNCGGCHAHSQQGTDFKRTVKGQPGALADDLTGPAQPSLEYVSDIRPALQPCLTCHNQAQAAGGLRLDNTTTDANGWPRDYNTLANDPTGQYGRKPTTGTTWREPNASGYIRKLQCRRSDLCWKIYNERLDGYVNTERSDDIDFTSGGCQAHEVIDDDTKVMIATWLDLGACIGKGCKGDGHKPTLTMQVDKQFVILGMGDATSGLNMSSVSVTHNGNPVILTAMGDARWSVPAANGRWIATATDRAGNSQTRELEVAVTPIPTPPSQGEVAYQFYGTATQFKTPSGATMEPWDQIPGNVQDAWEGVEP